MKYRQLQVLTILATIITLGNILWIFLDSFSHSYFAASYNLNMYLFSLMICLDIAFIYTIWNDDHLDRKKKWDKTWFVLLLGLIGMWFYVADLKDREREID